MLQLCEEVLVLVYQLFLTHLTMPPSILMIQGSKVMTQKKMIRNVLKFGVDCSTGVVHHLAREFKKVEEFDIDEAIHQQNNLVNVTVEHIDLVDDTEIEPSAICDESKLGEDDCDTETFVTSQFITIEEDEDGKVVIEKEKDGPQEIFSSSEASYDDISEGKCDYPDADDVSEEPRNCNELDSIKGNDDTITDEEENYIDNVEVLNIL